MSEKPLDEETAILEIWTALTKRKSNRPAHALPVQIYPDPQEGVAGTLRPILRRLIEGRAGAVREGGRDASSRRGSRALGDGECGHRVGHPLHRRERVSRQPKDDDAVSWLGGHTRRCFDKDMSYTGCMCPTRPPAPQVSEPDGRTPAPSKGTMLALEAFVNAAKRVERLESALREITNERWLGEARSIARAALVTEDAEKGERG